MESRLILARYKPFIIGVTGSVGKTSTKDAIYEVLRGKSAVGGSGEAAGPTFVRKSEKSFNSEIGLPLTIIGVPNAWRNIGAWFDNVIAGLKLVLALKRPAYPDCLVLEIGADHPGDIKRVARWLRPDIAVITRVSRTPVHVEFFNSPEEVFEEKASLAEAVKPGGTVILFGDDDKVMSIAERVKDKGVSVVSFGLNETATVRAADFMTSYESGVPTGITFRLVMGAAGQEVQGDQVSVQGILGRAYLYPLLAAAAVGKVRNIDPASIARSLSAYDAPRGRMNIVSGVNGSTLIDDTYNSSPDAASVALETLKSMQGSGSRIAVLGDMMELGKYAGDEHRKIGKEAADTASVLVTVGQRSRYTAEEAVKNGMSAGVVKSFDTALEAGEYVKSIAKAGDVILVKGSQSVRMERASQALLAAPERARELLVRQEREWLEKA
ncbi:MAG: UDP-N-acetylmuramoylalanyl-D-glutamyl-2,6-diaminopimelate--D-alanyl-D-alanyl ligase [Candidatus Parcubacteria bacterium]|nr:UDP-N-acetylmuramoylalanyl-D-glutamyl-2,6-diaminopimelate--D-alanyl-D-alanyl ligase [Candidatus Parcubacteria bacterium]